jgi:hypothetical protein
MPDSLFKEVEDRWLRQKEPGYIPFATRVGRQLSPEEREEASQAVYENMLQPVIERIPAGLMGYAYGGPAGIPLALGMHEAAKRSETFREAAESLPPSFGFGESHVAPQISAEHFAWLPMLAAKSPRLAQAYEKVHGISLREPTEMVRYQREEIPVATSAAGRGGLFASMAPHESVTRPESGVYELSSETTHGGPHAVLFSHQLQAPNVVASGESVGAGTIRQLRGEEFANRISSLIRSGRQEEAMRLAGLNNIEIQDVLRSGSERQWPVYERIASKLARDAGYREIVQSRGKMEASWDQPEAFLLSERARQAPQFLGQLISSGELGKQRFRQMTADLGKEVQSYASGGNLKDAYQKLEDLRWDVGKAIKAGTQDPKDIARAEAAVKHVENLPEMNPYRGKVQQSQGMTLNPQGIESLDSQITSRQQQVQEQMGKLSANDPKVPQIRNEAYELQRLSGLLKGLAGNIREYGSVENYVAKSAARQTTAVDEPSKVIAYVGMNEVAWPVRSALQWLGVPIAQDQIPQFQLKPQ